jgi:hypothetical protein
MGYLTQGGVYVKFLGLLAVVVTAVLAVASPAAARDTFTCNGVFAGATYDDVVVPRDGECTLQNATVKGNVKAPVGAYFQATGTAIGGSVQADGAQTIFVDTGSKVSGGIRANRTAQVFIYNARVAGNIDVKRSSATVQVCGTTVTKGDISVERSSTDILIGDPDAMGCAGNIVKRGDLELEKNFTVIEFVVRGNKITKGDLEVIGNTGPVRKIVEDNLGGEVLRCSGNGGSFVARGNKGWERKQGQCAKRSKKSGKSRGRR